jgi:hypothetical protein
MTFGPAWDDLVALSDVVAGHCARPVEPADDDTLAADLLLKRSLINRLELDFARDAARFDAAYREEEYVNPSAVSWLRENANMTSHAAARAAFLEDQVAARAQRTLTLTAFEGGCVEVTGLLDPEGGALLRTALDPLARPLGRDDLRSRQHRYADALVELCAHRLDGAQIPQTASQRSHLQVTTTVATLRDLRGAPAGEMEFAGLVAARTVQRLACDATITRILVDAPSRSSTRAAPSGWCRRRCGGRSTPATGAAVGRDARVPRPGRRHTTSSTGASSAPPTGTTSSITNTPPSRSAI